MSVKYVIKTENRLILCVMLFSDGWNGIHTYMPWWHDDWRWWWRCGLFPLVAYSLQQNRKIRGFDLYNFVMRKIKLRITIASPIIIITSSHAHDGVSFEIQQSWSWIVNCVVSLHCVVFYFILPFSYGWKNLHSK